MSKKILNRKKANPSIHIYTGSIRKEKTNLQLFQYNAKEYFENDHYNEAEFQGFSENGHQYWLNIHGIHHVDLIKSICKKLDVHDLAIQDILDINQRPKFQEYENYWFFTLKSVLPSNNTELVQEQLSFILGRNSLVSFQERKMDYFEHIRHRLRNNLGIIRERSSDYLLFLLLESILDNYFNTLGQIEDKIEQLGLIEINIDPSPDTLKTIELYKRQIHQIKKTILPIKEFVTRIERESFSFINEKHIKYYYELRDLCLSLIDECEQIEVRLESNINLFFSIQGHRMNQVMKTLTVVATIFIPLTFIAGVYGMNFSHMPELEWRWGYFAVWAIMVGILVVMIYYFKRKKWY